ncbi:ABC transporter ATP-binding protein [Mesorhizobium sp. A623]
MNGHTRDQEEAAISCRGVSKSWNTLGGGEVFALSNIDLDIGKSEFVVFLGPSGCGKSTLLYLIAGLRKPTSGTIKFHGEEVKAPHSDRALIFQETSLYPWLTTGQNVTFGLKIQGMSAKEQRVKALEYLNKVGLHGFIDKRPHELSGGMKQRAAVARALVMQPKALLMDEPFAALDIQTRFKLQEFLIQVWRGSQASVIFVTHSIDEALALADRVVVFTARPGRVKSVIKIDAERPRDLRKPEFNGLRAELTDLLATEVDQAFAEQERLFAADL